ncbi:MAG: transcriptional regulator BetI [Halofilum sp. (in: g-proteobacteria)]|nr:transcriptional regulator BetI [Halofilum sp. (in: g-proteobacteria)]
MSGASKAAAGDRRDLRRQQLIDATITVIGRQGYAGTRLADVARQAKVSYGVVGFYFKTKEDLLLATLQSLAEEYTRVWREAVDRAGPSPVDRLRAIIDADFSSRIASEKKIAVWYAFWAEGRTRPKYRQLCAELYNDYHWQVRTIIEELIEQGGYTGLDPHQVTVALNAMIDGMWLDLQIQPREFDREQAKQVIEMFLGRLFPAEFD